MDTGALASSLYLESEDTSESFLEEEDTAESRLVHLGLAKGETGRGSGTVASTKRKAGSWVKMIFSWVVFPVDSSSIWYL